jgi:hypothetical protein
MNKGNTASKSEAEGRPGPQSQTSHEVLIANLDKFLFGNITYPIDKIGAINYPKSPHSKYCQRRVMLHKLVTPAVGSRDYLFSRRSPVGAKN